METRLWKEAKPGCQTGKYLFLSVATLLACSSCSPFFIRQIQVRKETLGCIHVEVQGEGASGQGVPLSLVIAGWHLSRWSPFKLDNLCIYSLCSKQMSGILLLLSYLI